MDEIIATADRPIAPGVSGGDLASLMGDANKADEAIRQRNAANKTAATEVRSGIKDVNAQLKELTDQHAKDKAALGSLPTLQSEKFKAPDQQDPFSAFGSFAGTLAMIGSLMTKTPLTTALRASAAGMNAIKQKNTDEFDKAFEVWKVNSDAALKQANFELEKYGVASQAMQTDYAQGVAMARAHASLIQDYATLATLESPDPKDFIDLMNAKANAVTKLADIVPQIEHYGWAYQTYPKWEAANPDATMDQKIAKHEEMFTYPTRAGTLNGAGSPINMSEADKDYWAGVLRQGGSLPPGISRTAAGSRLVQDLMSRVPSGGGQPGDLLAAEAQVKADRTSLSNLTKIADSAEAYEKTALENIKLVREKMPKGVGISGMPWLDKWVQEGRIATGDPDVPAYATALVTVANEYAKVMSGSTGAQGSTVDSRREAAELLNKAHTAGQVDGVLDIMSRDMANKQKSYRSQRGEIEQRLRSGHTSEDPRAAGGGGANDDSPVPAGVDPGLWKHLTPDERKLWQTN